MPQSVQAPGLRRDRLGTVAICNFGLPRVTPERTRPCGCRVSSKRRGGDSPDPNAPRLSPDGVRRVNLLKYSHFRRSTLPIAVSIRLGSCGRNGDSFGDGCRSARQGAARLADLLLRPVPQWRPGDVVPLTSLGEPDIGEPPWPSVLLSMLMAPTPSSPARNSNDPSWRPSTPPSDSPLTAARPPGLPESPLQHRGRTSSSRGPGSGSTSDRGIPGRTCS